MYEPKKALTDNTHNGLKFYEKFATEINSILAPRGRLILEIGLNKYKEKIEKLFINQKYKCIWHKDLNGDFRAIEVYK